MNPSWWDSHWKTTRVLACARARHPNNPKWLLILLDTRYQTWILSRLETEGKGIKTLQRHQEADPAVQIVQGFPFCIESWSYLSYLVVGAWSFTHRPPSSYPCHSSPKCLCLSAILVSKAHDRLSNFHLSDPPTIGPLDHSHPRDTPFWALDLRRAKS